MITHFDHCIDYYYYSYLYMERVQQVSCLLVFIHPKVESIELVKCWLVKFQLFKCCLGKVSAMANPCEPLLLSYVLSGRDHHVFAGPGMPSPVWNHCWAGGLPSPYCPQMATRPHICPLPRQSLHLPLRSVWRGQQQGKSCLHARISMCVYVCPRPCAVLKTSYRMPHYHEWWESHDSLAWHWDLFIFNEQSVDKTRVALS